MASHKPETLMNQSLLFSDNLLTPPFLTPSQLPLQDRPAYRVAQDSWGCSVAELLAALIGGPRQMEIAHQLLAQFGSLHGVVRASPTELTGVRGIGNSTAARLKSALEISRRLLIPEERRKQISSPADAAAILQPLLMNCDQECMYVLLLDTRNRVIGEPKHVYQGSLNTSLIRIGELYRDALKVNAAAIVVAHNHPSGDPSPSPEDVAVTRLVIEAGKLLDIECLDHIVIGHGFVSLKERALGFDK